MRLLLPALLILASCASEAPHSVAPRVEPVTMKIGAICPPQGQTAPMLPRQAIEQKIGGTVVARARIANGSVEEVTILSGPEIFHAPTVAAMKKYKCLKRDDTVVSEQSFTFFAE